MHPASASATRGRPRASSRARSRPSQGTCSAGPNFTCSLGTIAAGGNATISVTYTVPSSATAGDRTNSVTVCATTADPVPGNNSASDTTTVVRSADLADLKTVNPNPVIAGNLITYTILVTNQGPSDADGVVLTDSLPAGLNSPLYCTGPGCTPTLPWTGSLALGTLTSGQTVYITIRAQSIGRPGWHDAHEHRDRHRDDRRSRPGQQQLDRNGCG